MEASIENFALTSLNKSNLSEVHPPIIFLTNFLSSSPPAIASIGVVIDINIDSAAEAIKVNVVLDCDDGDVETPFFS